MDTNLYNPDPSVKNFKISLAVAVGIATIGIIANISGWNLSKSFNTSTETKPATLELNASLTTAFGIKTQEASTPEMADAYNPLYIPAKSPQP